MAIIITKYPFGTLQLILGIALFLLIASLIITYYFYFTKPIKRNIYLYLISSILSAAILAIGIYLLIDFSKVYGEIWEMNEHLIGTFIKFTSERFFAFVAGIIAVVVGAIAIGINIYTFFKVPFIKSF